MVLFHQEPNGSIFFRARNYTIYLHLFGDLIFWEFPYRIISNFVFEGAKVGILLEILQPKI